MLSTLKEKNYRNAEQIEINKNLIFIFYLYIKKKKKRIPVFNKILKKIYWQDFNLIAFFPPSTTRRENDGEVVTSGNFSNSKDRMQTRPNINYLLEVSAGFAVAQRLMDNNARWVLWAGKSNVPTDRHVRAIFIHACVVSVNRDIHK